ncbi:MAG: signal peptidase [Planctomycetaceae bacterium]|nr:signal peptidase [Planctomycetaceae bacterium]
MKYVVHYGVMQLLGIFSHADLILRYGNRVIVKTTRGQEVGTVRCEATPNIVEKFKPGFTEGRIIRSMTETDEMEYRKLQSTEQEKLESCRRVVQQMEIEMELVRVEHIFGGERIVVYYTAEGRIDFRELVRVLAADFQTRIEMRQINFREEMKLLPHLGDCGRDVCCGCFLHEPSVVTIKMAKQQRVTLDPAKISGHCSRLKCCLRYEHDGYVEKQKEPTPPVTEPQS